MGLKDLIPPIMTENQLEILRNNREEDHKKIMNVIYFEKGGIKQTLPYIR